MSDADLDAQKIYLCRECDGDVFSRECDLNAHVKKKHYEYRNQTNLEIVHHCIYDKACGQSHWQDALTFLNDFQWDAPPYRSTMISKINHRLEANIIDTFHTVTHASTEACKEVKHHKDNSKTDYDADPIIALQVLFERLVLFPLPPSESPNRTNKHNGARHASVNRTIHERLRLFKQGRIRELYQESNAVVSKSPRDMATNADKLQKNAQLAIDLDNVKSANLRLTKTAPVAIIDDARLKALQALHPPSLQRGVTKSRRSTRFSHNRRKIHFTAQQIIRVLSRLHRGKAAGLYGDSLDIYIKSARRLNLNKEEDVIKAQRLAKLFSNVANSDIPTRFQAVLRKTYLVALEKDPDDRLKLRPLGVPSAIRRIATAAVLSEYSSTLADNLLPFNFAIGVSGGCDFITKTMQLGVDKYITEREQKQQLPTRALVSLDLVNMFNAISREELRQIISDEFPALESLADMLYEKDGETYVRMGDGTWAVINVTEGFSQGCPLSPVFAALVLNAILRQLQPELEARARSRLARGDKGDDGKGSIALLMAYVDDVNILLHHEDINWFLKRFVELAGPRGGKLNTLKTRILTSTSHESLVDKMKASPNTTTQSMGHDLDKAIESYSRAKDTNGNMTKVEVVDGLRVLGVPIGSATFCASFLETALKKATSDTHKILEGLEDVQSMVRVYNMCTVHKLTHLFGTDVINTPTATLPSNYFLWNSTMTTNFSTMTNSFLQSAIESEPLPPHAELITSMSVKAGGLGLQHPRTCAVAQFMLTTKRCLQYCHDGVWLGYNKPRPKLPHTITHLFNDWKSSETRTLANFRSYAQDFADTCCGSPDLVDQFVYEASINKCRETMREHAAKMTREFTLEQTAPPHVRPKLNNMLLEETSMALMSMPRLEPRNRMKNVTFCTAMKRKLRLVVIKDHHAFRCKCNAKVDPWGDHCLGCKVNHKTALSNACRDGIHDILKRILPVTKMIHTGAQMEKEVSNIVRSLPNLKPFDLSIRLNHLLTQGAWQIPFARIGFDVVLIHSNKPAPLHPSTETATINETDLRLREGERKKFVRRTGGTNDITAKTLSADEVIGEINDANYSFLPIAIGPHGEIGSIFRRFWDGSDPLPLPHFGDDRPEAKRAAERAISIHTPWNILGKADARWKTEKGSSLFDGSYLSPLPSTWAKQQLGLICSSQLANHINTSFNHLVYDPKRSFDDDERFDEGDWDDPDELDWNWIDVDFLDGQNSKDRATTPAVSTRTPSRGETVCAGSSCDELSSNTRSR